MNWNFDSLNSAFRALPAAYGARWNLALALGAGAAITTPWLLKNDDRGYGRTAALTTPVLTAGFAIAPGVWRSSNEAARSVHRVWNAKPFSVSKLNVGWNGIQPDLEYKTVADLQVLVDKGELSAAEFARLAPLARQAEYRSRAQHFMNLFRQKKQASVPDLQRSVSDLWERRMGELSLPFDGASFERDMNAALHEARIAAGFKDSTIGELTGDGLRDAVMQLGVLPEEQAAGALRVMKRRLTVAGQHRVGPLVETAGHEPLFKTSFEPFRDVENARDLLVGTLGEEEGGNVLSRLREAHQKGVLDEISLAMANGKAVGLRVGRKGEGTATFGFVDQASRRVLRGNALREEAAARFVRLNGAQYDRLDLWLTKNLHQKISDIREEIAAHTIHSGVDIDDAWSIQHQPDRASSLVSDEVAKLRGGQLAPSRFAIYNNGKKWHQLSYEERLQQEEEFRHVGTYIGNESGVAKGVAHLLEQEVLLPGMVGSQKKNDSIMRSITKNRVIDQSSVPESLRARYVNQAQQELFKNGTHDVGFTLGQVTPQQVAFFGALPSDVKDLEHFDGAGKLQEVMRTFGGSEEEAAARAAKAWHAMRLRFAANPLALHTARKMGSLGETQFLLHSDFNKLFMKEAAVARVSRFNLHTPDGTFSNKMVIGYDAAGHEILSPASNNVLKSAVHDGKEWVVHYERQYALETGFKLDALSKKGLVIQSGENELEMNLNTLNMLYGEAGQGTPFSHEVQALVNSYYFDTKDASVLGTLGQANDVMTRLSQNGGLTIAERYQNEFAKLNVNMLQDPTWNKATNSWKTSFVENTVDAAKSLEAEGLGREAAKAERLEALNRLTQNLMTEAAHFVRSNAAAASQDLMFRSYLSMQRGSDYSLGAHFERFGANVGQAFFWDTTRADIPKQVGVTYDMYTHMIRNGDLAAFEDILSSADPLHGDTRAAAEWAGAFFGKGGVVEPMGAVVDVQGLDAKTLFDPKSEKFRSNFTLDLGRERELVIGNQKYKSRYVLARGLDTYKAASNEFGAGETALTEYQRALRNVVEAAQGSDDRRLAGAMSGYADAAANDLFGKGGLLRPSESHPNSMALVIASRPQANPFEVVVSHDQLHRLDQNVHQQLINGEDVFAKVARHPVSAMPFVKVRLATEADHLGPNMVGVDEALRSPINSDDDRDTLNLLFLRSEKAQAEARRATVMTDDLSQMSNQMRNYRMVQLAQGMNEDVRNVVGAGAQTVNDEFFTSSLSKELSALAKNTREGAHLNIANRLAQGETGLYSNLLTRLHMNLEAHPTLQTSADRDLLENMFFQVRQVPISAGKNKMDFGGRDPRALWEQFQEALGHGDKERGVQMAQDAMAQILKGTGKKVVLSSERDLRHTQELFGVTAQRGQEINLYEESMRRGHGARAIREFVMNRDGRVDNVVRAFTQGEVNAKQAQTMLGDLGHAGLLGAFRTGRMAEESASMLGSLNRILQDGLGSIRKAAGPAAPILAAGAITAGALGWLGTNISSNRHRPEETAGVADAPPGQPIAGSMSNRPRVVMKPAKAQTDTMVVSPMQKNTNIEVEATAPNRAAAAETAKLVDRLKNTQGDSTVTVNYMGGARDRMSKLRMREQLREQLDLNDV